MKWRRLNKDEAGNLDRSQRMSVDEKAEMS